LAKDSGFPNLFRRAIGAKTDAEAAPTPEPIRAERPLRPRPERPASGHRAEPPAFALSDDPWERRVAALERILHEKNVRLLALEEEASAREQRMREALVRLREAEEAAEIGASLAVLPGEGVPLEPAPLPDALARLATEKGALETRERQLRAELDRVKSLALATERSVRAKDTALVALKDTVDQRDEELRSLAKRLEDAERLVEKARRDADERIARVLDEKARHEETSTAEAQGRRKLEQSLAGAVEQAALYRKTLVKTEDSLRRREAELHTTMAARDLAQERLTDLEKEGERLRAELAGVGVKLDAAESEAASTAGDLLAARGYLDRATTQVGELGRELAAEQGRVRVLEATLADRERSGARATAEATELRSRAESAELEVARLAAATARLEAATRREAANARASAAQVLAQVRVASGLRLLAATRAALPTPLAVPPAPSEGPARDPGGAVGALRRWFRRGE
jgi:DNA repair exonuclease SbcCD ATPase subunit